MIFVKNAAFVVLCRVWPSSPPCRVWRTTTSSRRRCPSRFWSTRLTGHTFSFCFSFTLSYQLTSRNLSSTRIWKISTLFPQAGTKAKMQIVNTFFSFDRCFFIAQSYVLVKKWSEALVLYERVLKYAKEVQSKSKSLNNSLKVGSSRGQWSRQL